MKYSYRYINSSGRKKMAIVEAASLEEAREKLLKANVYVTQIRRKKGLRTQKNDLKGEKLALFTSNLAHLLNAGIPLYESLLSLQEQYAESRFLPIIVSIKEQIKQGSSLAEALEAFPKSFDRLYISMVEAGESVGKLSETLHKLAHLLTRQNKLKKQLLTALLYPLILLAFSSFLIIVLLTFVVPSLEALFADQRVNSFTHLVFGLSHLLTRGWPIFLPLIGALGAAVIAFLRSKRGRRAYQIVLLRLPFVKNLIVHASLARFARTMGTLLEGGVSIISALQIARHVMKQPLLEEAVEKAERRVVEGSILSEELAQSAWIPRLVPRMLAIGEEGGNTAVMLGKIADLYEEDVEKLLTRLMVLAQPVILVFLGAIVGLIMLAILLPLTDVSGLMSGGF